MYSTQISAAVALEPLEERHLTIGEIAKLWRVSHETARRLFQNEPGVLKFNHPSSPTKRNYSTYRIPESIARRVRLRMMNV